MKTSIVARILVMSGIAAFGSAASASDELAGALIGAGSGAIIGHSIDRHDGAVVGGVIGAILGAAIADDDDRRPVRVHRLPPPVYEQPYYVETYYRPAPVVVYTTPRVRYVSQPVYVNVGPGPYYWKHHRDGRYDQNRDRDRDHRNDGRGDRSRW